MDSLNKETQKVESEMALSRRNFLKGGAVAALAAASTVVTGCSSKDASANTQSGTATDGGKVDEITQRLLDRNVAGANLPEATPVPPVDVPGAWDDEADVIVVGLGGGGLVACCYLAENGMKVIGIDKQGTVGGSSRHACSFVNPFGGAKSQLEFGFPGTSNGDLEAGILAVEQATQFSTDEALVRTLYTDGVEGCDYIVDLKGMNLVCLGVAWHDKDIVDGKMNRVLGFNNPINALEADAREFGADIRVNNAASTLVFDGARVLGVQVTDEDGNTKFLKGEKGVILAAGGIGMNKDLIKAYLPSAYEGAVQGGPMQYHTGEVFRMGLGVGADFSGYDSWCCWEGAIDESISGGDGEFWHYFWHGERQLFHNPWLIIDKTGKRQPYYKFQAKELGGRIADITTTSAFMSAPGHHVYSICDSNYATDVFKKVTTPETTRDKCRIPITDSSVLIENFGLVTADWKQEVEAAVARGAVKKADTLNELAEQLGLDAEILKDAVDNWNRICAAGVDDEMTVPYDPTWLSPIKEPPYYAAIIGGQLGKTLCGLRVNADLQVMNTGGVIIPGLYAGFSSAGGFVGENNFGALQFNGAQFGGVGSSMVSGYIAAKKLIVNE